MQSPYPVLIIILAGVAASVFFKKLTVAAAITGGILGWLIYAGGGYRGLSLIAVFFILGTAATSWKKTEKLSIRANAGHQSTRTIGQVIANAGIAALAGLLAVLFPNWNHLLQLMIAGSMSAAMADTLSSELGMVYGRRHYHILTWKRDEKGQDGVVSFGGLLIGIAGSVVIAMIYILGQPVSQPSRVTSLLIIVVAGTLGNLADSLLGAIFERQGCLTNNTVNLFNTLTGALAAGLLARIVA
ncbi:MAG TPA: DUF92 domain-containing protein [Puia sp.]|jgi:uncharacterized protein (TIGR00297 family)